MKKLKYDAAFDDGWQYASLTSNAFKDFERMIAAIRRKSENTWEVLEVFKSAFGDSGSSSSESWAESDLNRSMTSSMSNPALFVVSFCTALKNLSDSGYEVPGYDRVNAILHKHAIPLVIQKDRLSLHSRDSEIADVDESEVSTEMQACRFTFNEKDDLIGQGGFGTVYKATRTTSMGSFTHAVKVFSPSAFQKDYDRCLQRFGREIKAMEILKHRSIAKLLEAGQLPDKRPYILMEYVDGKRIDDACQLMSLHDRLRVFCEVADAVGYAHDAGILHRDLKPSNILIQNSVLQPVILDFGCAFIFDEMDDLELTTTLIGTQKYIPPEVVANPKMRNSKQDVFALGVMLYEALSGNTFNLQDIKSMNATDATLRPLDMLIKEATCKFDHRIENGKEFGARLDTFLRNFTIKKSIKML